MTEEEWDSVIAVHLKGHFAVAHHAAARWRAKVKETGDPAGAAIVNTASESGLYGNAGQSNYAAAKAGIASITLVMARELERLGVRVNAIAPVARTRLTEGLGGDAMKPDESGFDRFAPGERRRGRLLAGVGRGAGHLRPGGEGAGRHDPAARGLAPAHRGHRRRGVDARERGRPPRRASSGRSDGSVPAFFFASPPEGREPYPAGRSVDLMPREARLLRRRRGVPPGAARLPRRARAARGRPAVATGSATTTTPTRTGSWSSRRGPGSGRRPCSTTAG